MALQSPGIEISIKDESQFVASNIGSVPLVVLATAQDKTYNGASATGTSKAKAGKLQAFTSQRELVTNMGTPTFQTSAAGTPINGDELNEYGLLTAYSALGLGNQLYAIRADIDLNQLRANASRPLANADNGTYWLNLSSSTFGIKELNASTSSFRNITPLLITDPVQVFDDNTFTYTVPTPLASIGTIGSYAFVFTNTDGTVVNTVRLFYKAGSPSVGSLANSWVQVGSTAWQKTIPVVAGSIANPVLTPTVDLIQFANYPAITTTGVTIDSFAQDINSAMNTYGLFAEVNSFGRLVLFVTSEFSSLGAGQAADGKVIITSGFTAVGIAADAYYSPYFFYGSYAQTPTGGWFSTDTQPRPTGSVWFMTSNIGGGFNAVLQQYNASLDTWNSLTVPVYNFHADAIYALDPTGGGSNITTGRIIATIGVNDTTSNNLTFSARNGSNVTKATGGKLLSATPFTATDTFILTATEPGVSAVRTYTIEISGSAATNFVADVLAENIPYVSAQYNPDDGDYGSISLIHSAGGEITLTDVTGTPVADAQFVDGSGSGFTISVTDVVEISNWEDITDIIQYSLSTPYTKPADGTYWYYSNAVEIDIMINNNGWKGYRNVSSDVRGYDLGATDVNGVIVSASTPPVSQSTGASLVPGDLWLDSADLANFPKLYRYNGASWTEINTSDQTTSGGIIFADARWDGSGTTDIITGNLPSVINLLTSNYIDQDAPDYRLTPRGTLLFNTRRSGYNVKKYVSDYFNSTNFPNPGEIPGSGGQLPTIKDAWVSASGLDSNGKMYAGQAAQRSLIVAAMKSAIDSNTDAIEDIYGYNLLCAPGYPEVAANLTNLNNNRSNTGFIIADTPMTLAPDITTITAWVTNANGNGLPAISQADPYTGVYYPAGQTNDLAGNTVVVPASHAALRTFLYNDQVSYQWFAPAGANRGLVSNLNDVGYINANTGQFIHNGINQGLRNGLYPLKINPITQLPGVGIVIWAQQTRSATSSARNSINVVRLENYLRTVLKSVANGYLFEPNDTITRKSIAAQIEGKLADVLSKRGLYDFLVVCDSNNNTPSTIANQQLYVDVAIEPMRDVEFIFIPIKIYNPGEIAALNTAST